MTEPVNLQVLSVGDALRTFFQNYCLVRQTGKSLPVSVGLAEWLTFPVLMAHAHGQTASYTFGLKLVPKRMWGLEEPLYLVSGLKTAYGMGAVLCINASFGSPHSAAHKLKLAASRNQLTLGGKVIWHP